MPIRVEERDAQIGFRLALLPLLKGSTSLNTPRIARAGRRILLSLFPLHVGKPEGLLRATVAADLDRYTTQVSDLITQASDALNVRKL